MDIPHLSRGHIVAVNELGVVDPADNAPNHVPFDAYVRNRLQDGVVFHTEWLAIRKSPQNRLRPIDANPQEEGANDSI